MDKYINQGDAWQFVTFEHDWQHVDLWLPDRNNIDWVNEHSSFCECDMLDYIKDLDVRGICYDVGACFGNHTVYFSNYTLVERVISIEPCWASFDVMMRNVVVNRCIDVIPIFGACGAHRSWCTPVQGETDRLPHMTTEPVGDVPMYRLADLDMGRVGLIKIDVEGGEMDVLRGARSIIKRDHPELFIEAKTPEAFDVLREYLTPLGYKVEAQFNYIPTYHFHYAPIS